MLPLTIKLPFPKTTRSTLRPAREVAKPLASLKEKVKRLFKLDKLTLQDVTFEVALPRYAEERQLTFARPHCPEAPKLMDPELFQAMKALFDALHHPSVLDAGRHLRFGLLPSVITIKIDISSTTKLIEDNPTVVTSGDVIVSPTCLTLIEPDQPTSFNAPLRLLCEELDQIIDESVELPSQAAEPSPRYLRFEIHRFLGAGTSGQVFQARERVSKKKCALKVVTKESKDEGQIDDILDERDIHEKLQDSSWFAFLWGSWHDDSNLYFVMELYPTDLDSEILRLGTLDHERARFYMAELVIALTELNSRGIIHGDLKAANILIDYQGHIVISDFGLSTDFQKKPTIAERVYQPYWPYLRSDNASSDVPPRDPSELHFVLSLWRGSSYEMAPEIYLRQTYSFGIDWWALAVVLHWMLTGRPPFFEYEASNCSCGCGLKQASKSLATMIVEDPLEFSPDDTLSDDAKDIIAKMLQKNPRFRIIPGVELPNHPYFAGVNWPLMEERQVPPPWLPAEEVGHVYAAPSRMPRQGSNFVNSDEDPYPCFNYLSDKARRDLISCFQRPETRTTTPSSSTPVFDNVSNLPEPVHAAAESAPISIIIWDRSQINSPSVRPYGPGRPDALFGDPESWRKAKEIDDDEPSVPIVCPLPSSPLSTVAEKVHKYDSDDHTSLVQVGLWPRLKAVLWKIKIPKSRGWRVSTT